MILLYVRLAVDTAKGARKADTLLSSCTQLAVYGLVSSSTGSTPQWTALTLTISFSVTHRRNKPKLSLGSSPHLPLTPIPPRPIRAPILNRPQSPYPTSPSLNWCFRARSIGASRRQVRRLENWASRSGWNTGYKNGSSRSNCHNLPLSTI